ncbi:hypothetical protein Nepgr_000197 [Nepenthes gracilis]|uniref:Uncharacterized protein n=1 Tax=Nepenthes gracilis TaxID=150966 RepID=A0AAD3P4V5_NEPGR|nr:hypothetical protein Nepgr_000197 [Nepenthes gracilis]
MINRLKILNLQQSEPQDRERETYGKKEQVEKKEYTPQFTESADQRWSHGITETGFKSSGFFRQKRILASSGASTSAVFFRFGEGVLRFQGPGIGDAGGNPIRVGLANHNRKWTKDIRRYLSRTALRNGVKRSHLTLPLTHPDTDRTKNICPQITEAFDLMLRIDSNIKTINPELEIPKIVFDASL